MVRVIQLVAVAALAVGASASAAEAAPKAAGHAKTGQWVSPPQAGRPPLKEKPHGGAAVVKIMADALGLVRSAGPMLSTDTVNRLQWNGSGLVNGQKAGYSYALSLHLGAAREDVRPAGGTRKVSVVAGDRAWNETAPGVGQAWANDQAAPRALQLARTPFGFAKAALKAPEGSVKVEDAAGGTAKVSLSINGTPTTAELDPDYRPRRITMTVGGHQIEDLYTDYKDIAEYGIMFPTHMVEKTDGRVTLDIHISDARVASYAVFPPPAS